MLANLLRVQVFLPVPAFWIKNLLVFVGSSQPLLCKFFQTQIKLPLCKLSLFEERQQNGSLKVFFEFLVLIQACVLLLWCRDWMSFQLDHVKRPSLQGASPPIDQGMKPWHKKYRQDGPSRYFLCKRKDNVVSQVIQFLLFLKSWSIISMNFIKSGCLSV